jgi:threonine/homoserine/homoserine lactone efflux protein
MHRSIHIEDGNMLFDAHTLAAFVVAGGALVVAPGPGQALVVTRSLDGGVRAGVLTAVGLEIGTIVHTFAAALGLSAILATSSSVFAIVKYAGAAYLIALGIVSLARAREAATPPQNSTVVGGRQTRLVMHAALAGVLNPKVAVFFLAFLPQFVRPERGAVFQQFIGLGLMLATMGLLWDTCIATLSGRARARFLLSAKWATWRARLTGAVLLGLGLRLALAERR